MGDQPSCAHCRDQSPLPFDITMAFQPIVNYRQQQVFAYEALVRDPHLAINSAAPVLKRVVNSNRYQFDQRCRQRGIELAAALQIPCFVSINFMPNAVYHPETCIRTTLAAAKQYNFPLSQILFEFSEGA